MGDSKGKYLWSFGATADFCPMLAANWKYFQIELIPSSDKEPQSKLILSDNDDFVQGLKMFTLMDTSVAQVKLDAFRLNLNGTQIAPMAAVPSTSNMIAMIDSGGGVILCSNPAALDLVNGSVTSNTKKTAFTWPAPNGSEIGNVVWLQEVEAEFTFQGDVAFTGSIPAGSYTQLASIQNNRYLNGQDGFNIGAQLFQYHRVVFDVAQGRVGFGSLSGQ